MRCQHGIDNIYNVVRFLVFNAVICYKVDKFACMVPFPGTLLIHLIS